MKCLQGLNQDKDRLASSSQEFILITGYAEGLVDDLVAEELSLHRLVQLGYDLADVVFKEVLRELEKLLRSLNVFFLMENEGERECQIVHSIDHLNSLLLRIEEGVNQGDKLLREEEKQSVWVQVLAFNLPGV